MVAAVAAAAVVAKNVRLFIVTSLACHFHVLKRRCAGKWRATISAIAYDAIAPVDSVDRAVGA
jgi:hypothetical protein